MAEKNGQNPPQNQEPPPGAPKPPGSQSKENISSILKAMEKSLPANEGNPPADNPPAVSKAEAREGEGLKKLLKKTEENISLQSSPAVAEQGPSGQDRARNISGKILEDFKNLEPIRKLDEILERYKEKG